MKKIVCTLFLFLCTLHAEQSSELSLSPDMIEAREIFRSNVIKNDYFADVFNVVSQDIRDEFMNLIDDVWSFFYRMQTFCIDHIKGNQLFEKYKQYMHVTTIKSTVGFSIEDRTAVEHRPLCKSKNCSDLDEALFPFYETLSEQEQQEFKKLITTLNSFFDSLSLEYEQMLAGHKVIESAFSKVLEDSNKIFCIECGLESPFPTFIYQIK